MSENEEQVAAATQENGVKEETATKAEAQTEVKHEQALPTDEPESKPELKQEVDDKKPSQNGHDEQGQPIRDSVDQKIDRYQRDTRKPYQQKKKHIRSNFENLPETDDPEEIRRQVEFYFSDANLPMDAYLLSSTGGPENKPFPLKQLHTFKRMRRFQPYSAVLDAVKESKTLKVDEDGEVTRKTPLSEDYDPEDTQKNKDIYEQKSSPRIVYAKGFGDETETTQTDVEEFFAPYGDVSAVRLRRHADGHFKGSVLVEFADEDTAKQFLELDPKPKWQDKHELEFKTKKVWEEEKAKYEADHPRRDYGDRRDNKRKFNDDRGGRYRDDRRGGKRGDHKGRGDRRDRNHSRERRRDRDDEDWRDRRDRDRKSDRNQRGKRRYSNDKKRDRSEEGDDREEKRVKEEVKAEPADVESDDEMSKLNQSKKRSRDDANAGAEPEPKKVKEEEVKAEKGPEEVSARA